MSTPTASNHWRTIQSGGRERESLVHIPAAAPSSKAAVVLAFHGSASSAAHLVEFSGLNEVSDERGFIAVFPQGLGPDRLRRTWNAGGCCGWSFKENIDDVGFAAAILDYLEGELSIDPGRVYATGMSNGAMMAYRLAAELSPRIVAIAPVAGPMGKLIQEPTQPVSVCHFHGTHDDYAPYHGGVGKKSTSKTEFASAEASVEYWRRFNDCDEIFLEDRLPVRVDDGTRVTRRVWNGGLANSRVALYTIEGMGHTWPGRKTRLTHLGPMTGNLCASRVMWEFFEGAGRRSADR